MLQISNLSVLYKVADGTEHCALKNVSFELAAGEVVGVLGESGCGKSTLCLAILGLLPGSAQIQGGSVHWAGRDLLRLRETEMQKIRGAQVSLIFQEPALSLNPVMRIENQIAAILGAHLRLNERERQGRVDQLLADVQLAPIDRIRRSYPHELSGGQQQRVAIAQALACRPALIIADEPTASLDLTTQAEIIELMRGLRARHETAFLVVSHSPAIHGALADRVIVLSHGTVVEQGRRADIFRAPQNEYTRRLLRPFGAPAGGARA